MASIALPFEIGLDPDLGRVDADVDLHPELRSGVDLHVPPAGVQELVEGYAAEHVALLPVDVARPEAGLHPEFEIPGISLLGDGLDFPGLVVHLQKAALPPD